MKKFLTLLLALMMVLSIGSFSLAEEERPVLTIMHGGAGNDIETNNFTKYIEEQTGVDLQFIIMSDWSKIDLMVLAGEELADVICAKVGDDTAWAWAQSGAVIPLTPYYENPEFNANLVACNEIFPNVYEDIRLYDGEIYSIPFVQRELHSVYRNKMWINMPWLEEVGLEVPTNLDEFRAVLAAFKESHPDGYPILTSNAYVQGDFILWIMNSFIYDGNEDHLGVDAEGKLYPVYLTEEWKQALSFINGLVEDGLYDPDYLTMSRDGFGPLVKTATEHGHSQVGMFLNSSNGNFLTPDDAVWTDFKGMAPLEGPNGVRFASYTEPRIDQCWFITKDCDDPDLAAKVGIWFQDPTDMVFVNGRYGVEGVHRLAPTNPNSCYEGFPALFEQIVDLWATGGDESIWFNNFPAWSWIGDQAMMDTGDPEDWVHRIPYATMQCAQFGPKDGEFVPTLRYTPEEKEQILTIRTDLQNYINETRVLFAAGELSLEDDWDEYVQTCYDMGMEEFLEVAQTVYDRQVGE